MTPQEKAIALKVAKELEDEGFSGMGMDYTYVFAERFLAAIRESQEPVAWMLGEYAYRVLQRNILNDEVIHGQVPLFTTPPLAIPADMLTEVHLISDAYDKCRAEKQFAIDDLEHDLFAAGWKACAKIVAGETK